MYNLLIPFSGIAYARGNANLRTKQGEDISGNHLYGGMLVWHHGRAVQFTKDQVSKTHYGDDFHNYTMIWQRDKITLMVDEDIYGELYDGLPFFNEKCFIIFGVTVGVSLISMTVSWKRMLSLTKTENREPHSPFGNIGMLGLPHGAGRAP